MEQRALPILLIEDDTSLRESLSDFLADHGYRTFASGTAAGGWDLLRAKRPWLCLLDLNLPDGSGLDVLRKVAQDGLPTRVIVMTAFDLRSMRPAAAEHLLAGWLTKPVNPVELLKLVEAEQVKLAATA
jgi:DNA-binding response OmpR family regulator